MEIKDRSVTIKYRKKVIKDITKKLLVTFPQKEILSAFVYGSTLCEDFCNSSDYDFLVVFTDPSLENLEKLKQIKFSFQKINIQIDFNVHGVNDLPNHRGLAFWHNNRGIYLRKEIKLYGKVIIGENLLDIDKYDRNLLRLEVVRVLNSLVYQTRKYLVNKSLERENFIQILKWCIYAVQYSLAYYDIFPKSKTEALKVFKRKFNTKHDPSKFLNLKVRNDVIEYSYIKDAYHFLCEVDNHILENYKIDNK